ncbi:MAG: hypothetical protein ABID38_02980 [Candidatus Diapherotrites archaeon]
MSLYDGLPNFDIQFAFERAKKPLIVLAAIIIGLLIVLAFLQLGFLLEPKPIQWWFDKNPINKNEQTFLHVTVTNTTGFDAENVVVKVKAKDYPSISSEKMSENIAVLEAHGARKLKFLMNPAGDVLPGTYVIEITAKIGESEFIESPVLEIASND